MKHNHRLIVAFLAGWLVSLVFPPASVLGSIGVKAKAK